MTKEALKLALEALETPWNAPYVDGCDLALGKRVKAITAIKESLANEALEKMAENARELGLDYEPEQEPVAWMDDYNACKCPDNEARCFSDKVFRMMQKHTDSLTKQQEPVAKVCHDLDGHIGWNPNLLQLPYEGTPLYTTPPQRKPLTDEEERKAFEQWYVCNAFDYERNPIGSRECGLQWSAWKARAAHGIKGEA